MKTSRVVTGLAAALLAGAMAVAQGPGGPEFGPRRPPVERAFGEHGRWWNNPRLVAAIKLTDDQRKAMDAAFYAHREKLVDLEATLQKAELAMEPLMGAEQPSQGAIYAQIDKVVAARGDLERENSRFLLDIRLKLTPDQWKQLREFHLEGHRDGRPKDGPDLKHPWQHEQQPSEPPQPPQAPGTGEEE